MCATNKDSKTQIIGIPIIQMANYTDHLKMNKINKLGQKSNLLQFVVLSSSIF